MQGTQLTATTCPDSGMGVIDPVTTTQMATKLTLYDTCPSGGSGNGASVLQEQDPDFNACSKLVYDSSVAGSFWLMIEGFDLESSSLPGGCPDTCYGHSCQWWDDRYGSPDHVDKCDWYLDEPHDDINAECDCAGAHIFKTLVKFKF